MCNTVFVNAVCRLVLEWNALGVWDEAFSLFCDGLASNSTLTHLDLRNNQINHHGASELALALKHNNNLEVLGDYLGYLFTFYIYYSALKTDMFSSSTRDSL